MRYGAGPSAAVGGEDLVVADPPQRLDDLAHPQHGP
jgi:hypothetical protein